MIRSRLPLDDFLHSLRGAQAPLLVAALLRIGLMVAAFLLTGTQVMTQGDTSSYLGPGYNLVVNNRFASAGLPEIDRTPAYPIFAELTGMVWGNVLATVSIQIALSLASLLLVRAIADRAFPGSRARLVAAWLFAFEPLSILCTSRVMPETLFLFFLLLAIERILAYQGTESLTALAAAGISLAAATYTRPVGYYLGPLLAVGLAVTAPGYRGLRWRAPAVLLLTLAPWLVAWQLRNFTDAEYRGFSSIVEKNLYFFQSAEVTAELRHVSLEEQQQMLGYPENQYYLIAHPEQRAWSQAQKLQFMHAQALDVIAAHPALYLRTHIAGIGVVAFTPGATELLQLLGAYPHGDAIPHRILNEGIATSILRILSAYPAAASVMTALEVFLLFLYIAAIRGCRRAGSARLAIWTLVCIALYFLIVSGGAQAIGRYRLPAMPVLCVLAAGGLVPSRKKETAEPVELRSRDLQISR